MVEKNDGENLKRIATEILEPLYGSQEKALSEWLDGSGFKHTFVPVVNGRIAGLLSLKADPSKKYLKISTLVVLPEFRSNGCGRTMLKASEKFALIKGYRSLLVTVSETKPGAVKFFEGNGFSIISKANGKYLKGINELIMSKELVCKKGLRLKRRYFEMIASGKKKLEARINYPSMRDVAMGDTLKISRERESIFVEVSAIRKYKNFEEMLRLENENFLIPGASKRDALSEYQRIYPVWKVNKFGGVIVFALEPK